ncbi:MAG: hypothetical protein JST78_08475 [Bacteroidetes bacterium]|nr:hypothetical protein [Bacteroidota bacterium]
MKKHISKNLDSYILFNAIVLLIVFHFLNEKLEILIAIFGLGISITFGLRQNKVENDKMYKELFTMNNKNMIRNFLIS